MSSVVSVADDNPARRHDELRDGKPGDEPGEADRVVGLRGNAPRQHRLPDEPRLLVEGVWRHRTRFRRYGVSSGAPVLGARQAERIPGQSAPRSSRVEDAPGPEGRKESPSVVGPLVTLGSFRL